MIYQMHIKFIIHQNLSLFETKNNFFPASKNILLITAHKWSLRR